MALRNNQRRYGAVAMTLHWLIALAILANVALAFYFNDLLDHHDAARFWLVQTHKSIGLTVLVLSLLRLAWRLVNPVPPLPEDMSPGLKTIAHATHVVLYGLMILVPLLGWGLVSASRTAIPTRYFGLFAVPNFGIIQNMPRADKIVTGDALSAGHEWLGYVLLFLALGHIAAALYHHFGRRDPVLRRMLPGTRV